MGHLLSPPVSLSDPLMWADFQALCDLGGRVAGSASEAAALAFARQRLAAVPGAKVRDDPVDYPGWRCQTAQLTTATTGASSWFVTNIRSRAGTCTAASSSRWRSRWARSGF